MVLSTVCRIADQMHIGKIWILDKAILHSHHTNVGPAMKSRRETSAHAN